MGSFKLELDGLRELKKKLRDAKRSMNDWSTYFFQASVVVADSIILNFAAGGRPEAWIPSRRAERTGTRTLIDTGRLFNSITPAKIRRKVSRESVAGISAQTLVLGPVRSLGYGANLHFGASGYPARPWFLIQDEDVRKLFLLANDSVRREKFGRLLT